MTCDDCLRLTLNGPPENATSAERSAVCNHLSQCPECVSAIRAKADTEPPLTRDDHEIIDMLVAHDRADPEVSGEKTGEMATRRF